MAIHTAINQSQIEELLQLYSIDKLLNFSGIQAGITNSNYLLETHQGKHILTIFEELKPQQLPFFINLMDFLAKNNIPCAQPIADKNTLFIHTIQQKPCVLIEYLSGNTIDHPQLIHCQAIGETLAKMHCVTRKLTEPQPSLRGSHWHKTTSEKVIPRLSSEDKDLLIDELNFQAQQDYSNLETGIIHADLFPDNALFHNNHLTGIIDFYYACTGYYCWDLAVTVNSWCADPNTIFDEEKTTILVQAYQAHRPFTMAEKKHWNAIRRSAALRFWLSRLYDFHFPSLRKGVMIKNPDEIKKQIMKLRLS